MDFKRLPPEVIGDLGYSIAGFINLGNFPSTLDEFRKFPLQFVSAKILSKGELFLEGRKLVVKPKTSLVLNINDFMKMWHNSVNQTGKSHIKGTTVLKDNFKLYQGEDLTNKKLLVWTFGLGWGDCLFVQAILRFIKNKWPNCKITWALPKMYHSWVRTFNTVDRLIPTPFGVEHIKKNNYHLHFDSLVNGFKEGKEKNCYRLMAEFANLDIPEKDLNPQIPISQESRKYLGNKIGDVLKDSIVLLHLNTSSPRRNPDIKFKLRLLDKILMDNYLVGFVDSADKKEEVQFLIDNSIDPKSCINFCGITRNMIDVTTLVYLSAVVVSVDTSIIHIAAAVNTPSLGIYGPFPGNIRLETYNDCNWVDGTCEVSPCMKHVSELCEYGGPICYNNIDLDKVVKEINTLL